jgi:hypothetical protein
MISINIVLIFNSPYHYPASPLKPFSPKHQELMSLNSLSTRRDALHDIAYFKNHLAQSIQTVSQPSFYCQAGKGQKFDENY